MVSRHCMLPSHCLPLRDTEVKYDRDHPLNIDDVQISALTGGSQPEFVGNLYTYLIQKPQYTTPESRQQLVRRLREALVKCVSIVGVCRPIEAIFHIAEIERPEDKDYSFSRSVLLSSSRLSRLYE